MDPALKAGVLAAAVWSIAGLAGQWLGARSFGRRVLYAPAAGSARRGAAYALGAGLSPTAKESVREHLPIWGAGAAYHAGIFAAFGALLSMLVGLAGLGAIGARVSIVFGLAAGLGAAGGLVLLVRRIRSPLLRGLSHPDDYVANLLATLFAASAFAHALWPGLAAPLAISAMLLLLYVPVGKIRHCVFFFVTRWHAGSHFGRRGTWPPVH